MNINVKTKTTKGGEHGIGLVTDVFDSDCDLCILHIESIGMYCDEEAHARIAQGAIASYMSRRNKESMR